MPPHVDRVVGASEYGHNDFMANHLWRFVTLRRPSGETSLWMSQNELSPNKNEVVPGGRRPENELLPAKPEVFPTADRRKNELYPESLVRLKALASGPRRDSRRPEPIER